MKIHRRITWIPVVDARLAVISVMAWDSRSPWEILLSIETQHAPNNWIISRELFRLAMNEHSVWHGLSDVKIRVTRNTLELFLSSGGGEVTLQTSAGAVAEFLDQSYASVPAKDEDCCLPLQDHHLEELLTEWNA